MERSLKRLLFMLIFSLVATHFCFAISELDSLRRALEYKIENKKEYMLIKEARIDSLKNLIRKGNTDNEQYDLYKQIYNIYCTYNFDSAWSYINKCEEIAIKSNNSIIRDKVNLNKSSLLSTSGLAYQSETYLEKVNRSTIDSTLLGTYYSCKEAFYYGLRNFINDNTFTPYYIEQERLYMDSTFQCIDIGSKDYNYYLGYQLLHKGEFDKSEKILLELLKTYPSHSRSYAIVCSNLATIYSEKSDFDKFEKYLLLAAISDIEGAQKENMAMDRLASYLFKNRPNDLDKAYLYIQTSMEDAQFYNNRLRVMQVAKVLPAIVDVYNKKRIEENRYLKISIAIISLLLFFMILGIQQIYTQMKVLDKNKEELSNLNKELNYANKNKEEYVGMFMDLCSSYLNKMSQNRETVIRKILTKQIDELYQLNNSKNIIQSEINEFYDNFDSAFLSIYPTFLTEFNNLLEDDKHIKVRGKQLLNTELRIFALIRLGISDSSQIAKFLRYAPQTIYNYRTKVKNSAKGNRDDFESSLMKIGI